jgi:hypothetical protein
VRCDKNAPRHSLRQGLAVLAITRGRLSGSRQSASPPVAACVESCGAKNPR